MCLQTVSLDLIVEVACHGVKTSPQMFANMCTDVLTPTLSLSFISVSFHLNRRFAKKGLILRLFITFISP